MKRIQLSIGATVTFTIPLNFDPADPIQNIGSVDGATMASEIETAKYNGGMFIWAASEIESKLNDLIARALFPASPTGKISPQGGFFRLHFLEASHLEFSGKMKIVDAMIKDRCLMTNKERQEFEQKIRDVMKYRNAFAHGKITYDAKQGCIISYHTGTHKREEMNDALVKKLEACYQNATSALEDLNKKLSKPWPDIGLALDL